MLPKDAALINHTLCIHQFHRLPQTTTPITDDGFQSVLGLGSSLDEEGVAALPTLHASHSLQSANPQFHVFLSHSLSKSLMPPRSPSFCHGGHFAHDRVDQAPPLRLVG